MLNPGVVRVAHRRITVGPAAVTAVLLVLGLIARPARRAGPSATTAARTVAPVSFKNVAVSPGPAPAIQEDRATLQPIGAVSMILEFQEDSWTEVSADGQPIFSGLIKRGTTPVILPSLESDIRAGFDLTLDQAGIRPIIAAEVDDMAMLRVLAIHLKAVALVPKVVVQDELRAGSLVERYRLSSIKERFYAITPSRTFPNPLVKELITHATQERLRHGP